MLEAHWEVEARVTIPCPLSTQVYTLLKAISEHRAPLMADPKDADGAISQALLWSSAGLQLFTVKEFALHSTPAQLVSLCHPLAIHNL